MEVGPTDIRCRQSGRLPSARAEPRQFVSYRERTLNSPSGGVGTYVGACRGLRRSFGGEFRKCLIPGERNMACGVHSKDPLVPSCEIDSRPH